jgi:hypothetical protein
MVLIVAGLVIIIGYKAINNFLGKGCETGQITFENQLEGYITDHSTYGSVKKEQLAVPCSYDKLCFADAQTVLNNSDEPTDNDITVNMQPDNSFDYKLVKSSVEDGIMENIFLVNSKIVEPIGFMEEIMVNHSTKNVVCINATSGFFSILFEGTGKQAKISPVPNPTV